MVWHEYRSGGKPSAMKVTNIHWAPDSVPGQKEAEDVEGWTDSGKRKVVERWLVLQGGARGE